MQGFFWKAAFCWCGLEEAGESIVFSREVVFSLWYDGKFICNIIRFYLDHGAQFSKTIWCL